MKTIVKLFCVAFYAMLAIVLPKSVTIFDMTGMTNVVTGSQDIPVDNGGGTGTGTPKQR